MELTMKTFIETMSQEIGNLNTEKNENFGAPPDDFRRIVDNILERNGPTMTMIEPILRADQFKDDLVKSVLAMGGEKQDLPDTEEGMPAMLIKMDMSKLTPASLVRKNWNWKQLTE